MSGDDATVPNFRHRPTQFDAKDRALLHSLTFLRQSLRSSKRFVGLLSLVAGIAVIGWRLTVPESSSPVPTASPERARWVDESACEGCHADQYRDWRGSHHQLAMQPATDAAVLGDFNRRSLKSDVEISHFSRDQNGFHITTPDGDGKAADFDVAYTLGIEPLQQYLLAMKDGRLQVHGAAWDVSLQRWFHLYDGKGVDHRHPLHWSKAQQNADFMCIECHTTGFRRGFDPVAARTESRWQALGVGCQSCHGPASSHVEWVAAKAPAANVSKGFEHSLAKIGQSEEPEICGRCHSRRSPLGNGYTHTNTLLDDYLPAILTADLYEVDGKIKDEVFEYGSFQQSRMHAAAVVCSDCHNPHSTRTRAVGAELCTTCHNSAKSVRPGINASALQSSNYNEPSHHHHAEGSPGAQCVSCHMPGKHYMGNDLRRDHSFTSPNPIQALELDHSDACLDCHREDAQSKVLAGFKQWYPRAAARDGGYARDLFTARHGQAGAADALFRQLARSDLPDIRRATLLSELPNYPSTAAQRVAVEALKSESALVRHTAVEVTASLLTPVQQAMALAPLVQDPVRAVRLAATWQLLQLPSAVHAAAIDRVRLIQEYEDAQNAMLERAESHYNLAGVYQLTGREAEVLPALQRALAMDPTFFPALIMLAQIQEQMNDPQAALRLLKETIARYPQDASLPHALGLMQVRQGEREPALQSLRKANLLAPEQPNYGYVVAVALHDAGQKRPAFELLETLLKQHPSDRRLRLALISYLRNAGDESRAAELIAELAAQNPWDPLLQQRKVHE